MVARRIPFRFYKTTVGNEPVRDWLKGLPTPERKLIGQDMQRVEYRFPVGMPLCKPLGKGLYEVRTNLPSGRTARVFFFEHLGSLIALHAIIKKSQKTPDADLKLARDRMKEDSK